MIQIHVCVSACVSCYVNTQEFRLVLDISPAWCVLALAALCRVDMRGVNERTLSVCKTGPREPDARVTETFLWSAWIFRQSPHPFLHTHTLHYTKACTGHLNMECTLTQDCHWRLKLFLFGN